MRPVPDVRGGREREALSDDTYMRAMICAFIRSADRNAAYCQGSRDLGPRRNAPGHLSNEPHTSPVPDYEAVGATGVASMGAIEPASSSQYQTGRGASSTSDEERGGFWWGKGGGAGDLWTPQSCTG